MPQQNILGRALLKEGPGKSYAPGRHVFSRLSSSRAARACFVTLNKAFAEREKTSPEQQLIFTCIFLATGLLKAGKLAATYFAFRQTHCNKTGARQAKHGCPLLHRNTRPDTACVYRHLHRLTQAEVPHERPVSVLDILGLLCRRQRCSPIHKADTGSAFSRGALSGLPALTSLASYRF